MATRAYLDRIGIPPNNVARQQPLEDMDVPVVVDISVVGHGTVPETIGARVWVAIVGNGLTPPVESSVDPIGIPTRPVVDREAIDGEDADPVGLDDAVVVAQVPDAVPEMPAPSNSAVGADVPDTAPVAGDSPFIAPVAPMAELPIPAAPVCIDPATLEHAEVVVVIMLEAMPVAPGLTPGVASSVAPSGIPVAPTGAPGPIPSGEVTPSVVGAPVTIPTWAKAGLPHNNGSATVKIKRGFIEHSGTITQQDDQEAP
jgi:hypothetical protein